MKKMLSNEIRQKWLNFFVKNDHLLLPPVSLIPNNDPTLLWINSGVATLKDYFSGKENPPYVNLTNSQKAIRTNDIENVGVTARHHTFFEMLGNFSIGGYFKEHAIELAYNFLINELKIPLNKLYFTVYQEDDIAYNKWIELGVDKKHIIKCNRDRNFWDVGSGPCGPCTEIYYDRGEKYDPNHLGEKLFLNDIENDRYIEIWNIVFSEFNNDGNNHYTPLKRKNIDTGAGLERFCCIMQDVPTNFDTDLFMGIINSIESFSQKKYVVDAYFNDDEKQNKINLAYKVIADHTRALVMAIADGAIPSNKDRGYILRRLIRRIIVKQLFLDIKENIFPVIIDAVIKIMQTYYDSLKSQRERIVLILNNEYNIFQKTLKNGFKLFNECVKQKKLDKNTIFKMVDTYGFPIELIQELANEHHLNLDLKGFEELFKKHQEISHGNKSAIAMEQQNSELLSLNTPFTFLYDQNKIQAKVLKLYDENFNSVNTLENSGWVVFDQSCFYATGGGQLHDFGYVNYSCEVDDVIKGPNLQHIHHLNNIDQLNIGQVCELEINQHLRDLVTRNHSVEHLLHITLVKKIDASIKQEGAFKSPEKVTFDFHYHQKINKDQLSLIENTINNIIQKKIPVEVLFLSLDEAKKMGAMAYFEDVYKKIKGNLRVVKMGDESIELCGGTHVKNTGDIEVFKIIDCYPKGAGSWRIEAITSFETLKKYENEKKKMILSRINQINEELINNHIDDKKISKIIKQIMNDNLLLDEQLEKLKIIEQLFINAKAIHQKNINDQQIKTIKESINFNDSNNYLILSFNNFDNKNIFMALSECINEKNNKIFILINYINDKTQYLIAANSQYVNDHKINLNDLIKIMNTHFDGKGGGKNYFVQGGTNQTIPKEKFELIVKDYIKKCVK